MKEIFGDAAEMDEPRRSEFVARSCGSDAAIMTQVHALLGTHSRAEAFMSTPTQGGKPDADSGLEGPGSVVGPYKILEELGRGGFGTVYLAEQEQPVRRRVALKVVKAGMDTRAVIARFEAERRALAMMDHPHIARVLDAGATPAGRPYFAMELVRGTPITRYCDAAGLPIRDRLRLFVDVCRAVQHAHQKGIIHRDLKPDNVLVSSHDGVGVVKVIDFGIAKAMEGSLTDGTVYTRMARMIGTPTYMSPEQAGQSDVDIDTRSDVYSLGVLLYEMLTGTPPHDPRTLANAAMGEVQRIIREVEPEKPSTRVRRTTRTAGGAVPPGALPGREHHAARGLAGDLDWIAMKCLEKQRARRYDSADALAADIERHLDHLPVLARPPGTWYRASKFVRRNRGLVAGGAAVLITAAIGAGFAFSGFVRAKRERDSATLAAAMATEEADKARAVRRFLEETFAAANAELAGGNKDVTIAAALDSAVARLDAGRFADRPGLEGAVRLSVGRTYRALGNLGGAQAQLEKALPLIRREPGPRGTDLGEALSAWVNLLNDQRRYDQAESPAQEAVDIALERVGERHADSANAMEMLAMIRLELGKSAEAEVLQRRALAAYEASAGPEDRRTGQALSNLGYLYATTGRKAEAVPLFERAVAIQRREGETSRLATALANVAFMLDEAGKTEEAIARMTEAADMAVRVLGEQHQLTASLCGTLAAIQGAAGRGEEALAASARCLKARRVILPADSATLGDTIVSHGGLLLRFGRAAEAEPLLREGLAHREQHLAAGDWRRADAASTLGACLTELGRVQEAGRLLEQAAAALAADPKAPPSRKDNAAKRLEAWRRKATGG